MIPAQYCRMCDQEKKLEKSHIVPRSFLLSVKKGESQLVIAEKDKKSVIENVDPKERLFCWDCEQFLSKEYEVYGTNLLKKRKNVIKGDDYIKFKVLDYKKWYLFLLSILWRASISELEEFKEIKLGDLNGFIKSCVKNKTLKLANNLCLDEVISISMSRVVDKSGAIEDEAIKSIMLNLYPVREGDDTIFYFMVHGFLIRFNISPKYLYLKKSLNFSKSDMSRSSLKKVPIIDITQSKILCDGFKWMVDGA